MLKPQLLTTDPYATVSTVSSDGVATVMLGGDDMKRRHGRNRRCEWPPNKVVLALTLTAAADNDDISFPLDVGRSWRKSPSRTTWAPDTFVDAFTDYVTVFNIRPAQCELLFPVVTVRPDVEPLHTIRQSPSPTRRMGTKWRPAV